MARFHFAITRKTAKLESESALIKLRFNYVLFSFFVEVNRVSTCRPRIHSSYHLVLPSHYLVNITNISWCCIGSFRS